MPIHWKVPAPLLPQEQGSTIEVLERLQPDTLLAASECTTPLPYDFTFSTAG